LNSDTLVSIGLPVRNAGVHLDGVVRSVLAQDHGNVELVISDNASTDETEKVCRDLAATDPRIRYHRQPENVGLLNNFLAVIRLARGSYFRWIGDDDRLEPGYVSRCLGLIAADPRLILVTTQVAYTGPNGEVSTKGYHGTALGSDDPVDRFSEMLRLLNDGTIIIDPLYGLVRRSLAAAIPRRNMVREDEVFALKLALAGPWGHVPEALAHRSWQPDKIASIARRLGVPAWQARASNTLVVWEILRELRAAELTPEQHRRARAAVARMYLGRQRRTIEHRGRKLARIAKGR
jgi:glycosyltransferase involved in cell wall biosynthesis